jgi:hypothetical protein
MDRAEKAEAELAEARATVARYEDAAQSITLLLDWAAGDNPTVHDADGIAAHARLLQGQAALANRLAAARKPECSDCGRVVEHGCEQCPHCGNAP